MRERKEMRIVEVPDLGKEPGWKEVISMYSCNGSGQNGELNARQHSGHLQRNTQRRIEMIGLGGVNQRGAQAGVHGCQGAVGLRREGPDTWPRM